MRRAKKKRETRGERGWHTSTPVEHTPSRAVYACASGSVSATARATTLTECHERVPTMGSLQVVCASLPRCVVVDVLGIALRTGNDNDNDTQRSPTICRQRPGLTGVSVGVITPRKRIC